MSGLLDRVDRYLDAVPRSDADVEDIGPFVLFRSRSPWTYYARPRRDLGVPVTEADVQGLTGHFDGLGIVPEIEWVEELTPSLAPAAAAAGLTLERFALLVLEPGGLTAVPPPEGIRVEILGADAERLAAAWSAADVAFGGDGAVSDAMRAHLVARTEAGLTITAVATDPAGAVLATGSVQPAGPEAEIVGVGTLPAARRRGLGAAVSAALVAEAERRGASLTLISAQDDAVARVYERVGFRRIGTHAAAERAAADVP